MAAAAMQPEIVAIPSEASSRDDQPLDSDVAVLEVADRFGSSYQNWPAFERVMDRAAERLARSRWFRWEREILAAIGVWVGVLGILKVVSLGMNRSLVGFVPGSIVRWCLGVFLLWSAWYLWRVLFIRSRIIARRLCFGCGESLMDASVDSSGRGFCPKCLDPFCVGDYLPPGNCVMALARARRRTMKQYRRTKADMVKPTVKPIPNVRHVVQLYRDAQHFDQVVNDAARRLTARDNSMPRFWITLVAGLMGFAGIAVYSIEENLVAAAFALIAIMLLGMLVLHSLTLHRAFVYRVRFGKLCFRCGYALQENMAIGMDGYGTCPACGRRFHVDEYERPKVGIANMEWEAERARLLAEIGSHEGPNR